MVKIICAWCKADMGTRDGNYPPLVIKGKAHPAVSHGICDDCQRIHFPELKSARKQKKGETLCV